MAVSALDSRVFRDLFGTQEVRDIFSDEAYVRALVEAEAALARAQSRAGVIPAEAGEVITKALTNVPIECARTPLANMAGQVADS
jgi:3-carboxy-cis,cis-muconate cycloisomerase